MDHGFKIWYITSLLIIIFVWYGAKLAELRTPPIDTTDFLYIRFVGDRSINENDFGKIQKDRITEMKKWCSKLRRVIKEEGVGGGRRGRNKSISLATVSANNHYAGFGPGTANAFRKMIGLPEVTWGNKNENEEKPKSHLVSDNKFSMQSTISDFINEIVGLIHFKYNIHTCIIHKAFSSLQDDHFEISHKWGRGRFLCIVHHIIL
jgi:hypothetical protein